MLPLVGSFTEGELFFVEDESLLVYSIYSEKRHTCWKDLNGFWRRSDLSANFYTMSSAPVAPSSAQGCAGLGRIAVAQRQEAIGNTPHAELGVW